MGPWIAEWAHLGTHGLRVSYKMGPKVPCSALYNLGPYFAQLL
jgi:hypothetical protein